MIRKNTIVIIVLLFMICVFIIDALNNKATSYTAGSPSACTGSPGDNFITCTDCHSGPLESFQAGWITSNVPATGYAPGTTYTVTASITRSGHTKFGFEVSPQDISGNFLGTMMLLNSTETQLISNGNYITHKAAGTNGSGGVKSWSFNWIAPAQGTGDVTFYGAFNATNANGGSGGDTIFVSTLTLSECQSLNQPVAISGYTSICPGSSQIYSINKVADATSYEWILPAGWSGNSTDTIITVTAGSADGILSVRAIGNCSPGPYQTLSISISTMTASFSQVDHVSCNSGSNGSATAIPGGGNSPYSYIWNTSPAQNSATATGLAEGTFTVVITDVAGCSANSQITITQPVAINISASNTHSSCVGMTNGSASVKILSGGIQPFSFSWNTVPVQNNDTAINLNIGSYTVTVTDANSCTNTASVNILQAPEMTLNITGSNVSCNGGGNGSATALVSGGTNPILFSWNTSPVQTSQTATSLSNGNYTVTVTDNNGCIKTSSTQITEPSAINISVSHTNVSCNGGHNGTATVFSSGGTGLHFYSWNTIPIQNLFNATNLGAGIYNVTVSDANNCTKTGSAVISQPSPILLQTSSTNAACSHSNGTAGVLVSGGNPSYTYSWNSNPVQHTSTAINLPAGIYTVVVTDSTGCTTQTFATINNNSGVTTRILSFTNVSCHGDSDGAASVSASGGVLPYTYLWTPSGNATSTINGLIAGLYNVNVTDSNNCISSVVVTILEPTQVIAFAGNNITICEGDTTILGSNPTAYGGILPYIYKWRPGTFLNSDTVSNPICNAVITTTYTLTVTDSNSCQSTSQVTVTVNPIPAIPFILSLNDTLYCSTATFYQWYENNIIINGADTGFFVPTHSSNYSVSVSDSNFCTSSSAVYSFVLASPEEHSVKNIFLIYPNPVNKVLFISTKNLQGNYMFSIYDLAGNTIKKLNIPAGISEIDISNLQSGFYIVEMANENYSVVKALLVSR